MNRSVLQKPQLLSHTENYILVQLELQNQQVCYCMSFLILKKTFTFLVNSTRSFKLIEFAEETEIKYEIREVETSWLFSSSLGNSTVTLLTIPCRKFKYSKKIRSKTRR